MIKISTALMSLAPNAKFSIEDNDYDKIVWISDDEKPTKAKVEAEVLRLEQEALANQYKTQRSQAYPKIADQLDMLYHDIKNGTLDSGAWIQTIEAVKTQYPKP